MSLKRKGGVEETASVIYELQKERVTLKKKNRGRNSIVQEVGSMILL